MHAAYVLHTRAYRETSLLVEAITASHGRVSLVARGAKRGKSKASSILQPFMPLNIAWFGTGELVTLTTVEPSGPGYALHGADAICGLYMNELLVKLLPKWDPCVVTFANYQQALMTLGEDNQIVLRKFEKQLINNLGYALQLTKDHVNGEAVQPERYYMYDPACGLKQVPHTHVGAIQGASLLAFAADQYLPEVLGDIKRLMRIVLSHYLGNRKLVTRELL